MQKRVIRIYLDKDQEKGRISQLLKSIEYFK